MTERMRRLVALVGVVWWSVLPFAYIAGTRARWEHRCAGRTFTGTFDECFNDALPVLEMLTIPLTFILAYPFTRFAFSMFGPESDLRTYRWRFAASSGGIDYSPAFQIASAIGILWAGFNLFSMPIATRYWYLLAYWIVWITWFSLGAFASSHLADTVQRMAAIRSDLMESKSCRSLSGPITVVLVQGGGCRKRPLTVRWGLL